MAASTGPKAASTSTTPGFEGFPFNMPGRPPEEGPGKEQEKTVQPTKKPCRACTDFKSWMKVQKQEPVVTQVSSTGAVASANMNGNWLSFRTCLFATKHLD